MKETRIVAVMASLATMIMWSVCTSIWSYEASKSEIQKERVYASGDKNAIRMIQNGADGDVAIRAVAMDNGGAGIGIDISNWRALSKHPVRQVGAAVLDAGMAYGAYLGVQSLTDSSHDNGNSSQSAGRDNNDVTVNGDGNNVHVGDTTTTSAE